MHKTKKMGLVYTIGTPNGESDSRVRILSIDPSPQDGFILFEPDMVDILSDSDHKNSSKFISSILEIISAWENHGFFRFVEWNLTPP